VKKDKLMRFCCAINVQKKAMSPSLQMLFGSINSKRKEKKQVLLLLQQQNNCGTFNEQSQLQQAKQ